MVRPTFIDAGGAPGTLYEPSERCAEVTVPGAAVLVVTAPGEPRSGYARTYVDLARRLSRDRVSTLVVGVSERARNPWVDWSYVVAGALDAIEARGAVPRVVVARGLSAAVACRTVRDLPVVALGWGPVPYDHEVPRVGDLAALGFEEAWEASGVPERLVEALQADVDGADCAESLVRAGRVVAVLPYRPDPVRLPVSDAETVHAPPGVTDALFRRHWERAWAVATVRCLVLESTR